MTKNFGDDINVPGKNQTSATQKLEKIKQLAETKSSECFKNCPYKGSECLETCLDVFKKMILEVINDR